MDTTVLDFVINQAEDEWARLVKEFASLSHHQFTWRPADRVHSIGWHVRHAIEWRYALVHVWICGCKADERLCCLGWEKEPMVRTISVNRGWYDPQFTVRETIEVLSRVRELTRDELESLPPTRYSEILNFPWRKNELLHEIAQDIRHSALHRGHIRQLKKMYSEQRSIQAQHRIVRTANPTLDVIRLQ